jgi:hypothetical protein
MYGQLDIRDVPVERVVANLERELAVSPKDVRILVNLARVHAIAYAKKTDTVPSAVSMPGQKPGRELTPWLGYGLPEHKQVEVRATNDPKTQAAAKAALDRAVARYREAVAIDPRHLVARLGLGWTLLQSGDRPGAIDALREVVRGAWPADEKVTSRASVAFDADGSGLPKRWTWIRPNAAWLVYDRYGAGRIASGLQLFGTVTFWLFWDNGYKALRALDDDGDERIAGAELEGLALWHDRNADGVSDRSEVQPARAWRIVSIACTFRPDADTLTRSPSRRAVSRSPTAASGRPTTSCCASGPDADAGSKKAGAEAPASI